MKKNLLLNSVLFFCVVFLAPSLYAQTGEDDPQILLFPLMEEHVSSLMADRVEFNKDMGMGMKLVEVNERAALLSRESLMFPADELYNSNWENKWVNPFRNGGVVYPDSFLVDCSSFILPIDVDIKVTSRYGPRGRRMHRGIDLKVQKGDTIRAAFDGRVRIRAYERSGYGNYLVIRHSNGLETIYGHLSKFIVAEDQIVKAGEPIGLGGNTGRSTGSHLHFETRFLGVDINPEEFVDFTVGEPHQDQYVFRNLKLNGRNTNIFTASTNPSVYHVVKSGETLGKIARKYGTTVNELCRLNGLKTTSILRVGQSIRCSLGVDSQNSSPAQQVKTNTSTAKTTTVAASSVAVASLQENVSMQPQEEVEPVYHRIQSGDTLSEIAQKYGTTVTKLCALNGISRTTILRLGRNLRCM